MEKFKSKDFYLGLGNEMKRIVKILGKFLIGILLVVILLYRIDFVEVYNVILKIHPIVLRSNKRNDSGRLRSLSPVL